MGQIWRLKSQKTVGVESFHFATGSVNSLIHLTTEIVNQTAGLEATNTEYLTMQAFLTKSATDDSLSLSYTVIRQMSTFIEIVSCNLKKICQDMTIKADVLPDEILEILQAEDDRVEEENLIRNHIIEFVVTFAYVQNLILEYLKRTLKTEALILLKQVTVSNGLKKITPPIYRVLTWMIVQYVIDQGLVDQTANSDSILIYFTMIFGHMTRIYNAQCVPKNVTRSKTADQKNSRPRDNFRAMRIWQMHMENILDHKRNIETQIENDEAKQDVLTIDTEVLKDNDCLIMCCRRMKVEKRRRSTDPKII